MAEDSAVGTHPTHEQLAAAVSGDAAPEVIAEHLGTCAGLVLRDDLRVRDVGQTGRPGRHGADGLPGGLPATRGAGIDDEEQRGIATGAERAVDEVGRASGGGLGRGGRVGRQREVQVLDRHGQAAE